VNNCGAGSLTLNALGGSNGNYIWYDPTQTVITGQTNASYSTPVLSSTVSYFVAITNGTCTSGMTTVVATIDAMPTAPAATGATGCPSTGVTLNAAGGSNGSYVWYDTSQTLIPGQTNSTYTTPSLLTTTNFYVAIISGACTSSKTTVTATISQNGCSTPVISSEPLATQVGGIITLNLVPLISTPNSSLDLASLLITSQPSSGAKASISASGVLTIDYTGVTFSGTENISIRACDINGNCSTQQFSIEVAGDIIVYNGISPNGNNPIFFLEYINLIPETQSNTVQIFDRWQNRVWHGSNYDNSAVVFKGVSDNGSDLPSGVYFYKIEFASGRATKTGFISLRR
jgi:hypothetical protein